MTQTIYDFDWEHAKTGGRYRIVTFAIREEDLCPIVIYRSTNGGGIWERPVAQFFDGRFRDTRQRVPVTAFGNVNLIGKEP
jgi:hypothetical protein